MANSVARIENGAESADVDNWRDFYSCTEGVRLRRLQSLRDPLRDCTFRTEEVDAVYGYITSDDVPCLVYFWSRDLHSTRWNNLSRTHSTAQFLHFGALLSGIHAQNPTIDTAVRFLGKSLEANMPDLSQLLGGAGLYWGHFGDVKLACLYRTNERASEPGKVGRTSSSGLLECLYFHLDYCRLRSPLWSATPMRYLFRRVMNDPSALLRLHVHPKCFIPNDKNVHGSFLWPWQECIQYSGVDSTVNYSSMETTSLVFDLRKSTVAMQQVSRRDLGRFSSFIKNVLGQAKEAIFRHGGFFDKETGDGLVAHFVNFSKLYQIDPSEDASRPDSPEKRAFDAAIEVVRRTARFCEEFQRELTFGVSNLGGAIGLHTGQSVWIAEKSHVQAIGDSVIFAARLCSEAKSRHIFVSNSQFLRLFQHLGPDLTSRFEKQLYTGKEGREDAGLFGYSLRIGDNL